MQFHAKNTGFSTELYPVYAISYWWPCGVDRRTYGRTDGWSRDYYVTTKISWLDRLPNFLSNGAPQLLLLIVRGLCYDGGTERIWHKSEHGCDNFGQNLKKVLEWPSFGYRHFLHVRYWLMFNFENKKKKKKDNHRKQNKQVVNFNIVLLYSKSWWQMWLNSLWFTKLSLAPLFLTKPSFLRASQNFWEQITSEHTIEILSLVSQGLLGINLSFFFNLFIFKSILHSLLVQ